MLGYKYYRTKHMNINEHIRFFNRLRAILEICASYEEADATYIEVHDIDINEDDKSLLNVGYSYTIAENRDVVPAFEIVPLKYFEMSLDEIREDIKRSREEEI